MVKTKERRLMLLGDAKKNDVILRRINGIIEKNMLSAQHAGK